MSVSLPSTELSLPIINEAYYLERAHFGLGNFISFDLDHREDLLRTLDLVIGYIRDKRRTRPLNLYIEASPGSGKSFLVKQIYKATEDIIGKGKINQLFFNATYFINRDDILHSFRKFQSVNIENKLPLVFMDEIDSKMSNGEHAYKQFLAPMYDGKYFKDGHEWHIGNCICFFAASKKLENLVSNKRGSFNKVENKSNQNSFESYKKWIASQRTTYAKVIRPLLEKADDLPEKMKDFMDRIDDFIYLPPSNLIPNGNQSDGLKQAQYIAVSLLLARFPQIHYVDSRVIALLAISIINSTSRRDAESCIFRSYPPVGTTFELSGLPGQFIEDNKSVLDQLETPVFVNVGEKMPD